MHKTTKEECRWYAVRGPQTLFRLHGVMADQLMGGFRRKFQLLACAYCRLLKLDDDEAMLVDMIEAAADDQEDSRAASLAEAVIGGRAALVGDKSRRARRPRHEASAVIAAARPVGHANNARIVAQQVERGSPAGGVVAARARMADIFRDIFNPFVSIPHRDWYRWNSPTVQNLARAAYNDKDFKVLPVLADAMEEAGCDSREVLDHLRGKGKRYVRRSRGSASMFRVGQKVAIVDDRHYPKVAREYPDEFLLGHEFAVEEVDELPTEKPTYNYTLSGGYYRHEGELAAVEEFELEHQRGCWVLDEILGKL
jgi:hypothetical protein